MIAVFLTGGKLCFSELVPRYFFGEQVLMIMGRCRMTEGRIRRGFLGVRFGLKFRFGGVTMGVED